MELQSHRTLHIIDSRQEVKAIRPEAVLGSRFFVQARSAAVFILACAIC